MNAIVLEVDLHDSPAPLDVRLNKSPVQMEVDFPNGGGFSGDLWYPTVSPEGVISWEISKSITPPAPVDITGPQGNGIESVDLIDGDHSPGTYDTYRITFTDGTYTDYQVWNGSEAQVETFIYQQSSAAAEWSITHNLGRFPSVTVVDTAGTEVVGNLRYINSNQLTLTFNGAFAGTAYLN